MLFLSCTSTKIETSYKSESNLRPTKIKSIRLDLKRMDRISFESSTLCSDERQLRLAFETDFKQHHVKLNPSSFNHLVITVLEADKGCHWCRPWDLLGFGDSKVKVRVNLKLQGIEKQWVVTKHCYNKEIMEDMHLLSHSIVQSIFM